MSRCFTHAFSVAILALALRPALVLAQAETEPNGTLQTANLVGASGSGTIGCGGNPADANDYFKSVLPEDGTLVYYLEYDNTSGSTQSDFYSYIYNRAGGLIGSSSKFNQALGVGRDTITIYCRARDTVYYRLFSSGCFGYSFRYEMRTPAVNDVEPNGDFASAKPFARGQTVGGRVGYTSTTSDANDYHFSELPDDGTLTYYVEYDNTSGSTDADFYTYIYNSGGGLIGSSSKFNQKLGTGRDTIVVPRRAKEKVYFRIFSSGCFSYQFRYELATPAEADAEPNDNFQQANSFSPDETVVGRIGYTSGASTDANDYFFSELPDDGTLTYYVEYDNTSGSAGADFYTYIYNSAGGLIGSSSRFNQRLGVGRDTITVYCRAKEKTYFRIFSSLSFTYKFNYKITSPAVADTEPNNTFQQATYFAPTETVGGRIGYTSTVSDANDYFRSVLPDDGTLIYYLEYDNTSNSTGSDLYSYIYNRAGGLIGSSSKVNQPLGISRDTITLYGRAQDTVYFRLTSSGCFNYKFRFEVRSPSVRDEEPNDNFASAKLFAPTDVVGGRIGYTANSSDANDYFKSVLPEDGTLVYYLEFDNTSNSTGSDLYSYIYNRGGGLIGSSSKINQALGTGRDTIVIPCRARDTVYFRLTSSGSFSYTSRYEVQSSGVADREPNESFQRATLVPLANGVRGRIGYNTNVSDANDYFKVVLPAAVSDVEIRLDAINTSGSTSSDLYLALYNQKGGLITSKSYINQALGSFGESFKLECAATDTLYVRLYSSGCFSYDVRMSAVSQTPQAAIESTRYGNRVAFIGNSGIGAAGRADAISWNFGDGTTSAQQYPVHEFAIGSYSVTFTATNEKCKLTTRDVARFDINGIEYYTPHRAGLSAEGVGYFDVRVFGAGLGQATEITLTGDGKTLRPFRIGAPSTNELTAMFDLKGASVGVYDVRIKLASGEVYDDPRGFEIYADAAGFAIEVEAVGPSRVRTNRWTPFTLSVTNDRGRLANGAIIGVVTPRGVETNLADLLRRRRGTFSIKGERWDELSIDREDFNQTYFQGEFDPNVDTVLVNFDTAYAHLDDYLNVDIDSLYGKPFVGTVHLLYLPIVLANATEQIQFQIKSPANQDMVIATYAWPGTMRINPLNGCQLDWIHEGGMQAAALAAQSPNPYLKAVGKAAGYVDILSKIAFNEYYDWKYGGNAADEAFYAEQLIALGTEVSGELVPYGGRRDGGRASAKRYSDRAKQYTQRSQYTSDLITPGGALSKGIAKELSDDLARYAAKAAQLTDLSSSASEQALINAIRDYATGRGIDLSNKAINALIANGRGDEGKNNEPKEIKKKPIKSVASLDPNAIYGDAGAGAEQWLRGSEGLDYLVTFENVDTAEAAAQIVRVEVDLDPRVFDLARTYLGDVQIGGRTYFIEAKRQEFFRDVDLRAYGNDVIVRVNGKIDTTSGRLVWQFTSLDPATMSLVTDVDAGFLPPNITFPNGEGGALFTTRLRTGLRTGDSVVASALIYFDENAPISTEPWRNRVDKTAPVTRLDASSNAVNDSTMVVYYTGSDTGSGLTDYYLHARAGDSEWLGMTIPVGVEGTAEVKGVPGQVYSFYVVGQDAAGNRESKVPRAELTITMGVTGVQETAFAKTSFVVFPNPVPSGGGVYVRTDRDLMGATVELVDDLGRVLQRVRTDLAAGAATLLEGNSLAAGHYYVRIVAEDRAVGVQAVVVY